MNWGALKFFLPESGKVSGDESVKAKTVEIVSLFDAVRWCDLSNNYSVDFNACIIGTAFNGYPHHLPLPLVSHWPLLKTIR